MPSDLKYPREWLERVPAIVFARSPEVPFYRLRGYEALEDLEVPMAEGLSLRIVRMGKVIT